MLKRWFLIVGLFLTMPLAARANDSAVQGVGGRWKRLQEGKTAVQMVRENVLLNLDQRDSYKVTADFIFRNHGRATTVKMGFPESGFGDIPDDYAVKTAFTDFRTLVDGKASPVFRRAAEHGEEQYDAFWVKTVSFKAGQTRHVRVSYRSPNGGRAAMVGSFCLYSFTGGNWQGKVEKSVLTVRLSRPGAYLVSNLKTEPGKQKPVFVRRGNDFIYTWKNWQAEDSFLFGFAQTLWDWLAWSNRDPRSEDTYPVKIPGKRDESYVGFIPGGVIRNGKVFVNLRQWAEMASDRTPVEIKAANGGIIVTSGGKTATYSTSGATDAFVVHGRYMGDTLFVAADRLTHDFGARFLTDSAKHKIVLRP